MGMGHEYFAVGHELFAMGHERASRLMANNSRPMANNSWLMAKLPGSRQKNHHPENIRYLPSAANVIKA